MSRTATKPDVDIATGQLPPCSAVTPITPDELIRRGFAVADRLAKRLSVDFTTGDLRVKYDTEPPSDADSGAEQESPLLDERDREVLDALGQTPDEWVLGDEICRRIGGGTTTDRTFYRITGRLKKLKLIDSVPRKGFRLL